MRSSALLEAEQQDALLHSEARGDGVKTDLASDAFGSRSGRVVTSGHVGPRSNAGHHVFSGGESRLGPTFLIGLCFYPSLTRGAVMTRHAIATILVGQRTLLREGLARILIPPEFRVVASGPRIDTLDARALGQYEFRLLIIESGDDVLSDIEHIAIFKKEHPADRIAILGHHWRPADIMTAFRVGVNVYFAQMTATEQFLKAIELVMLGQTILPSDLLASVHNLEPADEWQVPPPDAAGKALPPVRKGGSQLSTRERGVLHSITKGASNKMIARESDISEATVKVHVKAILRKIGAVNRTQAAIWALQHHDLMCPAAQPPASAHRSVAVRLPRP